MKTPCPHCHRMLQVPESSVGHQVWCPACKARFAVAPPEGNADDTIFAARLAPEEEAPEPAETPQEFIANAPKPTKPARTP